MTKRKDGINNHSLQASGVHQGVCRMYFQFVIIVYEDDYVPAPVIFYKDMTQ